MTAASGIGADCCTTVASWADYDNDGDLDLYVGRYLDPRTKIPTTFYARNGEPNQLYRNDGRRPLHQRDRGGGRGGHGALPGHRLRRLRRRRRPDLYVVNDFGRNTLYRNEGDGDVPPAT